MNKNDLVVIEDTRHNGVFRCLFASKPNPENGNFFAVFQSGKNESFAKTFDRESDIVIAE